MDSHPPTHPPTHLLQLVVNPPPCSSPFTHPPTHPPTQKQQLDKGYTEAQAVAADALLSLLSHTQKKKDQLSPSHQPPPPSLPLTGAAVLHQCKLLNESACDITLRATKAKQGR